MWDHGDSVAVGDVWFDQCDTEAVKPVGDLRKNILVGTVLVRRLCQGHEGQIEVSVLDRLLRTVIHDLNLVVASD